MMVGSLFTGQLLFNGVVEGLIVAVMAMGIVLVYRSSRVINFAAGELGVPAAAVLAIMVSRDHIPYWLALLGALVIGAASGAVVELIVIRRLALAPRVIVLVATIGVYELAQTIVTTLPGFRPRDAVSPTTPVAIKSTWTIGSVQVSGSALVVLLVVPLVTVALWLLLSHSKFGEAVHACATNTDLARLSGVSPKIVASAIWTIAGLLSAVAVILWAPTHPSAQVIVIGPDTLLLGFTAALFGRMRSFPKSFAGAIAVGLLYQLLAFNYGSVSGLSTFVLFIIVLVLVATMRRDDETGGEAFAFGPRVPAIPERLREIWWVRNLNWLIAAGAVVVALLVPLVITSSGHQYVYLQIIGFMICAVSVTVLTGWAGQLSLGQMAFAGIGALSAAALVRGVSVNVGWHSTRIIHGALRPVPFTLAVLLGAIVACVCAVAVGFGALRVKGLLLAISTFAFALACEEYLFGRPIFTGSSFATTVELPRGHLFLSFIDLSVKNKRYYYASLVVLIVVLLVVARVRRSGIGRAIIGVRENEAGVAALTVSPIRVKLIAFATAGFIAGLGGAILGGAVQSIFFGASLFRVEDSLNVVAMAVIGGLGSIAGAALGTLWVVGLPAFFPTNQTAAALTSSVGLLVIILYIPGGFTQIAYWFRSMLFRWLETRLPERPVKTTTAPPESLSRIAAATAVATNDDGNVLATHGLTVKFGGLVAVNNVDVHAASGEIVGLIGINGAGKSTLLNAIGGFVSSTGRVQLLGREISRLPPHRRARAGLGRTFQAATLFPELTVRETVELALEARLRTSFWSTITFWPGSFPRERVRRADARELIDFLGLGRYADRFVAELSTGTRRIVELASVLAVAPRVILLDEPTAGVAQREAEAFGPLIRRVQQELGATLMIVEHDLPMILALSDRIYCMEAGAVIAEGTPADVRNDPRVIASYMGTDERAIARSDAPA
jgi:ABC-type branched-subunit amino acid transport system ATPase component/ABC-type branched-subunit amino acid transport system permease subunit